jgi:hypothetical protein
MKSVNHFTCLHGSARHVIIGHGAFLKRKGSFSRLRTACINPPINTKLGTFEYLVNTTNLVKFGYKRMGEVVWASG